MTTEQWGLLALVAVIFIAALVFDEVLNMAGLKDTKKDCGENK